MKPIELIHAFTELRPVIHWVECKYGRDTLETGRHFKCRKPPGAEDESLPLQRQPNFTRFLRQM
ncbi:hypothetical protein KUTeg_018453 [Tegillarca granosa]|uniref:Uncharacterized protein n=1 Tax=Tegillarca granosa TaxID=220873 RepID=A0ABQ9EMU9_TEGGR|nr:hypothetical protein KUTeg_018453 [Tegillarca granosa]